MSDFSKLKVKKNGKEYFLNACTQDTDQNITGTKNFSKITVNSKNAVTSINGINADTQGNVTIDAGSAIPDYNAGVIVSGYGFTASADGIWVFIAQYNSARIISVKINGTATAYGLNGTSGYQDQSAQTVPLKKGDVISWTGNPSIIHSSTFYPYSR